MIVKEEQGSFLVGWLRKNWRSKYEVFDGEESIELSCGVVVYVWCEYDQEWVEQRLDHRQGDYYLTKHGHISEDLKVKTKWSF